MAHERHILAGMTDFTGVPITDITQHLEDWRRRTDSAIEALVHGIEKVRDQSSLFEDPEEAVSFGEYFIDLFSRYKHDLDRLTNEVPNGVTQAHVEIVEQMYRSSKHEDAVAAEFKRDWISKRLPNEEARPVLSNLYVNARRLLTDFRDLSNLVPRLKTFVSAPIAASPREAERSERTFPFINAPDLRALVERDYAEILAANAAGCWKSVIILSGGAIEAILTDLLLNNPRALTARSAPKKKADITTWDLKELINVSIELKLVSQGVEKLSHPVRQYRNITHPGNEIRNGLTFGEPEARIAIEVLHMLHRDLTSPSP